MRLLQSEAGPSCPFEKGGLDEYFLDVTALAVRSWVLGVGFHCGCWQLVSESLHLAARG